MPLFIALLAIFAIGGALLLVHIVEVFITAHLPMIIGCSAGGTAVIILILVAVTTGLKRRTLRHHVRVQPRMIMPAPPRRQLPAPTEHTAYAMPLHPFSEPEPVPVPAPEPVPEPVPEPAAEEERPTCEGPDCDRPLPDSPWQCGTAPALTGAADEEEISHSFCSRYCMNKWMHADMDRRAAEAAGRR